MRKGAVAAALFLLVSQCGAVTYDRAEPGTAEIDAARADIRNAPQPARSDRSFDELVAMADRAAQRLRGGMKPLCAAVDAETCNFSLRIASNEIVNAFVDKEGNVWLTLSLLQYLETEDEVAAIIAHELAHLLNGDTRLNMTAQKQRQAMRYELGGSSPASAASRQSGIARHMISIEANADHLAGFLLHRAGYSLETAERLWIVLEKMGDRKAAAILATHPFSGERLAAWRILADMLEADPELMPRRVAE